MEFFFESSGEDLQEFGDIPIDFERRYTIIFLNVNVLRCHLDEHRDRTFYGREIAISSCIFFVLHGRVLFPLTWQDSLEN